MTFNIQITTIIVWIIIGLLAGTAAGSLLSRSKRGYGLLSNTLIGLMGALIGGLVFDVFQINIPALRAIQVDLQQLLAAFVGALLFVFILRIIRSRR